MISAQQNMKLSIPAWNNNQYLSLSEILLAIGWPLKGLDWYLNIEETSIEPGAEALEKTDPKQAHSIFELLKITTPTIQIIDGEVIGTSRDGEHFIKIQAIDSTSWDIDSNRPETLITLKSYFPSAIELLDQ